MRRAAEKFGISFKKYTLRDWRKAITDAHPGETLEIGYEIYSGCAEQIMAKAGLDAAISWLFDRIADPKHAA